MERRGGTWIERRGGTWMDDAQRGAAAGRSTIKYAEIPLSGKTVFQKDSIPEKQFFVEISYLQWTTSRNIDST